MIEGFVGQVLPEKISGWAFDRDCPSVHLVVDIYSGERHLGTTSANLYRMDLDQSQVGNGDHGFTFLFPVALEEQELAAVVARAHSGTDPRVVRQLPRHVRHARLGSARVAPSVSKNAHADDAQFPVFVIGSPRSGTSAVAQSLIFATSYGGYHEGNVLDVLFPLLRTLRRFYESKEKIPSMDRATMMISKTSEEYFADGITALFAKAVREQLPARHWCDKTPTVDMVRAAPILLRIWPNAKFIFLKRRALENLLSRARKFAGVPFESQCLDWSVCMEAWLEVRGELGGRALELDQYFLARRANDSAEAIGRLLSLTPEEVEKLGRVLSRHQPQRTSASVLDVADAATMNWDSSQWAVFERVCGPAMAAYGYSRDQTYYAPGAEDRSCITL